MRNATTLEPVALEGARDRVLRRDFLKVCTLAAGAVGLPAWAGEKMAGRALRTVYSFDPCLACAIHTVDGGGQEIARVKVL